MFDPGFLWHYGGTNISTNACANCSDTQADCATNAKSDKCSNAISYRSSRFVLCRSNSDIAIVQYTNVLQQH